MIDVRHEVRWSRLNVPGDLFGVNCDENGPSIGPIRLLQRTERGLEPRFPRELDFIFGTALGRPMNFAGKMQGLKAAADALGKGDLTRAMLITQFLWLPSLPDERALERAVRADTLAKAGFNPGQPRDERGRWALGGGEQRMSHERNRSGFIPVQGFATPGVIPWMEQILPAEPLPEAVPFPGEILPPAVATPDIALPRTLQNPYPERADCAEEWADAHQYCGELEASGQLGHGDNRGQGQTYAQCVRGRVSERCGGNPVNRGPRPSSKPPRGGLI